ncbi:Ras guanyl-nucleotide exchange factor [Grosmannia clavigera kw1407]|uniref:Ras guanyl-nucleotide exchange factor n=1 Tax=Grosmannia clavigera (strain kw1407 / UAMH 11150) TaxID=655863 RepID=F0X9U2_GROCL|nr:Ras guanyl-nucleotide exchange factor [Grosmannia clavigera kw1407]EFX05241.1 Ras guanyl-nucleotide exchange factor [Grosmannia clavigera kw1407]
MASTRSPEQIRALYRSFLRELPPRPILVSPRAPLHSQLRAQFESAAPSASATQATASPSLSHGEHYVSFLQAQRVYTTLLERYNPGMAGTMDEEERIRLTARRVGMNLPVEFSEDAEGKEKRNGSQ